MSQNEYLVACSSNDSWDKFLESTLESSPFMQSWFADTISNRNKKLFYIENGEQIAAVLIYPNNNNIIHPKFSIYHSLAFRFKSAEIHKITTERYRVLGNIIRELSTKYDGELNLSFHPKIADMRPILWHNYESTEARKFQPSVRYTAALDLSSICEFDDYLNSIRENRRRDYRKSLKNGIKCSIGATEEELLSLYKKTFERQQISLSLETISFLQKLFIQVNSDRGFIVTARNSNGVAIAITACLHDKDKAYSLIIANDPEHRNSGANTSCLIKAIFHAKCMGKKYFDFIGANSPNRGDFKLSFNADLNVYYDAHLRAC